MPAERLDDPPPVRSRCDTARRLPWEAPVIRNTAAPHTWSVRGAAVFGRSSDQPSAEDSSSRLRVRAESSGMPGPIVVDIVALLM